MYTGASATNLRTKESSLSVAAGCPKEIGMTTTVQQMHLAGKAPAYLKGLFESPILRFTGIAIGSVVAAATFLLVLATPAKANSATISEGFKTPAKIPFDLV